MGGKKRKNVQCHYCTQTNDIVSCYECFKNLCEEHTIEIDNKYFCADGNDNYCFVSCDKCGSLTYKHRCMTIRGISRDYRGDYVTFIICFLCIREYIEYQDCLKALSKELINKTLLVNEILNYPISSFDVRKLIIDYID